MIKCSLTIISFFVFILTYFNHYNIASAGFSDAKPVMKLSGISIAKGIKEDKNFVPLEMITNTFTTEDKEVIAFVKFENMQGRHKIKWNWYSPENKLEYSSDEQPIIIPEGKMGWGLELTLFPSFD